MISKTISISYDVRVVYNMMGAISGAGTAYPFRNTCVHHNSGVHVAQSLVFCVVFCISLCLLLHFLLAVALSVHLWISASAYPFWYVGIFISVVLDSKVGKLSKYRNEFRLCFTIFQSHVIDRKQLGFICQFASGGKFHLNTIKENNDAGWAWMLDFYNITICHFKIYIFNVHL